MQTTLRIQTELYRQAKVEAARTGITLTQFIQEALAMRLAASKTKQPVELPVYRGGSDLPHDFDLVKAIKELDSETDLALFDKLVDAK